MGVDLDKQLVPVDVWPHPLTAEGRREALVREGLTLADVVREQKLGSRVVRAWIDGVEVPAELLEARTLKAGEIMTVRADVAGGRGGGNKVLRTLLQIAVIAAGAFVPGALSLTAGSFAAAAVSAGVLLFGNLLINALVPPEVPRLDDPGSDRATPVYSLSGGANRARLYAPLILVLGEHRVFPDLAAAEYSTFEDGEQFLHQVFDFGLGDIEQVDQLQSGNNPLTGFSDVSIWRTAADIRENIAGNVDTLQGADLTDTGWVDRRVTNTGKIQVDFVARIFKINAQGENVQHSVEVQVQYRAVGSGGWSRQAKVALASESQTHLRRTLEYDLGSVGDWDVQVRRSTSPIDKTADGLSQDDQRTYDDVAFSAIRAFQPDPGDYEGRNRIGIRFKASAQLQGRLDRISGRVRQKVPVWDGSQWTAPQASSNPAWIFRWFAMGHFIDGRLVVGRGLPGSRIDDNVLKAWGAWCDANSLTCNYVIDREQDVDAIQRIIARCGRASPSWQTGKLGVVYDRENQTPVAMINPGNIIQGTLGVEWVDSKVADEVVLRYIEPNYDWQWNSIRRTVPGTTGTPVQSTTVTLNGVTSAAQAASMAGLLAAAHKYHKRRVTWEMAAEGLSIRRGNVVWIHHGLLDGGETGHLAGGTAAEVQLDREVTLPAGQNWLQVRLADGAIHTSAVTAGSAADRLSLTTPLPAAPDAQGPAFDVLWRLYDASSAPLKFKVTSVEPQSGDQVRLVAIDERPEYYAAANQTENVVREVRGLPLVRAINASKRFIRSGQGNVLEVEVVLTVAGDWQGGEIRVGRGTAESVRVVKVLQGDDLVARFIEEPRGTVTITAIPHHNGGLHFSGAESIDFNLAGGLYDIAPPTDFAVVQLPDGTRRFGWVPPEDPDLAGIVIRHLEKAMDNSIPDWGAMTAAHAGLLTSSPWETVEIPPGDYNFAARSVSTSGDLSEVVRTDAELTDTRFGTARWLTGTGDPPETLGLDGNVYLDTDTATIWQKISGTWTRVASLAGADGAVWFSRTTAPPNALGENGDWCFVTGSGELAGTIYNKLSGAWVKIIDIDQGTPGATWLSGSTAPSFDEGKIGDYYFRTSNGFSYQKTSAGTAGSADETPNRSGWVFLVDITGLARMGIANWHVGIGRPAFSLGNVGDWYQRSDNGWVYYKESGPQESDYGEPTIPAAKQPLPAPPAVTSPGPGQTPQEVELSATVSVNDSTPNNGSSATWSVAVGGTLTGAITYQWQRSSTSGGNYSNVGTNSTYSASRSTAGTYWVRCVVTRGGQSVTSSPVSATWSAGSASTRTRTYYQRGTTAPSAPTSSAFSAYTTPGGGWSTSDPGATSTQNVYQVTLTQHFNHATTQTSSTFDRNVWSAVTLHEAKTTSATIISSASARLSVSSSFGERIFWEVDVVSGLTNQNTTATYSRVSGPNFYNTAGQLDNTGSMVASSGNNRRWFEITYSSSGFGAGHVLEHGTYVVDVTVTKTSDNTSQTRRITHTIS